MSKRLTDKVAIVTGAARGLGRAYAEALAGEGAAIVVADIADCSETAAAVTAAGGSAIACPLDVADGDSAATMAATALDAYGGIDILVNNAALYGSLSSGPFDRLDEAEWDACMAVNVKGIWIKLTDIYQGAVRSHVLHPDGSAFGSR